MDALESELQGDPQVFKDRVYKPLEPLNDHMSSPWRPQGDLVAVDNVFVLCVQPRESVVFTALLIVLKCNYVNYLKYY